MAKDGTVIASTYHFGGTRGICVLNADGSTTTLAGGEGGFADGRGEAAQFSNPYGLAIGADGRLYVADCGNDSIRSVDRQGNVTTVAGRPRDDDEDEDSDDERERSIDGDVSVARFNQPFAVAVASDGTIYVGESGGRVRQIRAGVVSTIYEGEAVYGLCLDDEAGLLYVTTELASKPSSWAPRSRPFSSVRTPSSARGAWRSGSAHSCSRRPRPKTRERRAPVRRSDFLCAAPFSGSSTA